MSSETEILRARVAQQEKQLRVLRAAVVGREELLSLPNEGVTQAWLVQFKKQLREQTVREMKAAAAVRAPVDDPFAAAAADGDGADASAPRRGSGTAATVASKAEKERNWRAVEVHTVGDKGSSDPDYDTLARVGETEACEALIASLLATTQQLVGLWQDALRERFHGVLTALSEGFHTFKSAPTDASLQKFLSSVNELQPEITTLLKTDDEFSGAPGNPFSTDYAELKALYSTSIGRYSAACIDAATSLEQRTRAPDLDALTAKVKALEVELGEVKGAFAKCTAQRDTLGGDVAKWKEKHDAAVDVMRRMEAEWDAARRAEEEETRAAAEYRAREQQQQQQQHAAYGHGMSPNPSSRRGPRAGTPLSQDVIPRDLASTQRVRELKAALGHLEVQLTAACNSNNNASSQRHLHIRRKIEAVRAELAREERGGV